MGLGWLTRTPRVASELAEKKPYMRNDVVSPEKKKKKSGWICSRCAPRDAQDSPAPREAGRK